MNEDIITALNNSIQRGENLTKAINILINSGYNPKDVEEASKYIGGGITQTLQVKPDEHLTMPEKKGFFTKKTPKLTPSNQQTQAKEIKQPLNTQQLPSTKPTKKTDLWIKEVILFAVLIILIGILVGTIFFKDTLISFISN